jgi:peptidoglycan hydrolase-like protein with peptidoglycan-binding domain
MWLAALCFALAVVGAGIGPAAVGTAMAAPEVGRAEFAPDLRRSMVSGIQEQLIARGFMKGRVTGRMDARTTAGIRAYQRAAGLPVTGNADQALANHINFTDPKVVPRASGGPVPDPYVRAAQERLAKDGFYWGPIDGLAGEGTAEAVRAWQERNGLEPTGRITPDLLLRMGAAGAGDPGPR